MGHRRQKLAVSDLIAGQLVGDNHPRHVSQALEQVGWPEGVAPSGSHRTDYVEFHIIRSMSHGRLC